MEVIISSVHVLRQLLELIPDIRLIYNRPLETLHHNTIGGHYRHVIEFYQCLLHGLDKNRVNYDERPRNLLLETDQDAGKNALDFIIRQVNARMDNPDLVLYSLFGHPEPQVIETRTNYHRELIYNLEHAVHHMAIIRIGLKEALPTLDLSHDFGVASSTIRHQMQK